MITRPKTPLPRRSLPARLWHWLVSEPIADRYDRTARALADPYYTRCYAPRTHQPAAVVLPTVEEVVDIIKAGGFYSDITRAQLDAAAIAARNEFYGADRGPEATSEWREVVVAALNAYTTAADAVGPIHPDDEDNDRTARALADPSYDRAGCYCHSGPHHHPACPRRTR